MGAMMNSNVDPEERARYMRQGRMLGGEADKMNEWNGVNEHVNAQRNTSGARIEMGEGGGQKK